MLSVVIIHNMDGACKIFEDFFSVQAFLEALEFALLHFDDSLLISDEFVEIFLDVVHVEVSTVDMHWPRWVVCEVFLAAEGILSLREV